MLQQDATSAVRSIAGISDVIEQINAFQATIASAVEEQSTTTGGMADALQRAAGSTGRISEGMSDVVTATQRNRMAAEEADRAAQELSTLSEKLRQTVAIFRL